MPPSVLQSHENCQCEECIIRIMEAVQIGMQEGLAIAESRLACHFERKPLGWDEVRVRLWRDG